MFSPKETALNYINVAKSKVSQPRYKTLLLAVLAGAYIALGAIAATFVGSGVEGGLGRLLKGMVFPVGLILVVICGAELFTGNCLLISPVLGRDIRLTSMLKNWGIVYGGNIIGGVLIATLVVYSHIQPISVAQACVSTALSKSTMSFGDAFLRGILCNMLVCLAVWGGMTSKSVPGKILALYFPIMAFVICGFEHSVANMYYLGAGLMTAVEYGIEASGLTFSNAIVRCLIPSTLGNIIGGGLIAVIYHTAYRLEPKKRG